RQDVPAEGSPAQLWLGPEKQDDVPLLALQRVGMERVLRPVEATLPRWLQADSRTRLGKVEEVLGIDLGEAGGRPCRPQRLKGMGRRLPSVIPPGERGHEERFAKCRDLPQLQNLVV